uniref:Raw n=1 Tax=Bactrocera latifrons TaxID=174628 RepID=A0A0K8UPS0_BACLA
MASLHATNSCSSSSCSTALTNNKPLTPTKNTVKLLNGKSCSDCGVVATTNAPTNNNNSSKSYNNLSSNVEQLFNSALKALHLPQCVGGGTADSGVGGGGGKKSPGKVKTNGENKLTLVVQKCAKNIDIAAATAADNDDIDYEQHDLAAQEAQSDADSVQLRCACPAVHATSTDANNVNNKNRTMTVTTTFRSSSTSALMTAGHMRPQTLNVHHLRETPSDQTQIFIREVLNAWRAKARCNVVPAERTQELFHELSFHPSEKQITEMLQTAKLLARKGSRQSNGLTFGEFCVLAADLKRFRTSTFSPSICDKVNLLSSLQQENNDNSSRVVEANNGTLCHTATTATGTELRSTKSLSNVEDCKRKLSKGDTSAPVEVFLGGSCNPTTWRADVAIPALNELGISFYNPQVSDWTPDLIELEHRAKEKARVLFFVMDSETRASAGAIEAAHIAGQNCKQLVLVLHPYKRNQSILNEQISQQEYIDLRRNQLILKELVTRRGLPVMDDIPSGLQRTKDILAGIRDPPSNIATILVVVRGAFDRVNPVNGAITVVQCQRALLYLGYAQSLVKLDNLNKIIATQRETLEALQKRSTKSGVQPELNSSEHATKKSSSASSCSSDTPTASLNETLDVDFDLFCVISAYLSVLQQEIQESGCISPIKGTNVPPPPVYLTNMQGDESNFAISYFTSKNISRTSSQTSVPGSDERPSSTDLLSRNRDSGTSSPQPLDQPMKSRSAAQLAYPILSAHSTAAYPLVQLNASAAQLHSTYPDGSVTAEEESDSNDSVFSSSSSINSVNCNYGGNNEFLTFAGTDFRDVYLGGSCFLRTKWRQDIAMPYLKTKGVTFHLPALHESLQATQLDSSLPDKVYEDARQLGAAQEKSLKRTRRKYRGAALEEEEEEELTVSEETYSWALPPMRPSLYNPSLLDASRVLLFIITNETRSLAPMTLAAHCIGLMYNVVLAVQMLPDDCVINNEKLTPAAIKDYNRGRSYLIDLAKRQGVPVFSDLKAALECTVDKIKACNSRGSRYD